ncbi:MAG: hypothetical protein PHQ04_11945 [Opitutaceae bacterium]|nr:hypothetical protein [Opitutaceae bacterium]
MIALMVRRYDQLLLAFSVALWTSSVGWWLSKEADRLPRPVRPDETDASGHAYTPISWPEPADQAMDWPPPSVQSRGTGWIYEVFGPPVIHDNAGAKAFLEASPEVADESKRPFGLEVVEIKLEGLPLQLAGCFVAPGGQRAAFVCPAQAGMLFARRGERISSLGLTLKSLEMRKVPIANPDSLPVFETVAIARLRDEQTGTDIELDSRSSGRAGMPVVRVRSEGADEQGCELHEGETYTVNSIAFRIEHIQFNPAEVVVARLDSGPLRPVTRRLKPLNSVASGPAAWTGTAMSQPAGNTREDPIPPDGSLQSKR